MFICIDDSKCAGIGKTLDEAFKEYQTYHCHDTADNCKFYEAEQVVVELKIQRVETIKKVAKSGG